MPFITDTVLGQLACSLFQLHYLSTMSSYTELLENSDLSFSINNSVLFQTVMFFLHYLNSLFGCLPQVQCSHITLPWVATSLTSRKLKRHVSSRHLALPPLSSCLQPGRKKNLIGAMPAGWLMGQRSILCPCLEMPVVVQTWHQASEAMACATKALTALMLFASLLQSEVITLLYPLQLQITLWYTLTIHFIRNTCTHSILQSASHVGSKSNEYWENMI